MPKSEAEMCMCERAASHGRAMTCLRCTGPTMPNPDTRAVVTEEDMALAKAISEVPFENSHALYEHDVASIIAAHRIAAEARVSAREEAMRKALRDIVYEAERPAGGLVHMKRCIASAARRALHTDGAGS